MLGLRNIKPFSKEWFAVWQPFLLLAVNFPDKSIREEVRYRLGIILDRNILINWLFPNSFRIKIGQTYKDIEYMQTFYGKNVFAESLYRELLPMWKLIHKWDVNFANRFAPALNLGFDILPSYPDAGSGATTVDGWVKSEVSAGDTFAGVRGAAGVGHNEVDNYITAGIVLATASSNLFYRFVRGLMVFDTSLLPDTGELFAADIQLYEQQTRYRTYKKSYSVCKGAVAINNNLSNSDYDLSQNIAPVALCTKHQDNISPNSYTTWPLNDLTYINRTGVTVLGYQIEDDRSNTQGNYDWTYNYEIYDSNPRAADNGVGTAPKLIITHTIPIRKLNVQNTMTQIRM